MFKKKKTPIPPGSAHQQILAASGASRNIALGYAAGVTVQAGYINTLSSSLPQPTGKNIPLTPNFWMNNPHDEEWQAIQVERVEKGVQLKFFIIECPCDAHTLWFLEIPKVKWNEEKEKELISFKCPACGTETTKKFKTNKYTDDVKVRILESWSAHVETEVCDGVKAFGH